MLTETSLECKPDRIKQKRKEIARLVLLKILKSKQQNGIMTFVNLIQTNNKTNEDRTYLVAQNNTIFHQSKLVL